MPPSALTDPPAEQINKVTIEAQKRKRSIAFLFVVTWVLLTAVFAFINRQFAHAPLFETGDFAANSVLIQDAKHLQLWVGHYSRVGFNHPGPALLYVLAAGEWLLFDRLHVVDSPLSGQIFAAGAYNAFWLSAMGLLFFRMRRSISVAVVSWLFVIAITAYVDHSVLGGLWPPHLIYFPFSIFTLALMRLLDSKSDSLLILAFSCGLLVHGHVSFIAICGLMVTGTLVLNWLRARRNLDQIAVFSLQFVAQNQRTVMGAAVVLFLFLLPLLVETLRHFPGPLIKYATYNGGNKHNDIGNALAFVAQYWGFKLLPLLTGMFALYFFMSSRARGHTDGCNIRNAAPVLFLSTAAVLFYAINGIDNLNMPYLGLFYYSTPAIAIALMFSNFLPHTNPKINATIAMVVALIALPFIYRQAAKPIDYAPLYSEPKIPQYFEKLAELDKNTIALDLDQNSDWGRIWSTLIGIEAYAMRHERRELFCIGKNWHILFTERALCTQSQLDQGPRFFVSTDSAARALGTSAIDLDGITFYKLIPPILMAAQKYDISSKRMLFAANILGDGWSPVDGEFVWSEGKSAKLVFRVDTVVAPTSIALDLGAYLPKHDSTQTATLLINGNEIGAIDFSKQHNRDLRLFALPKLRNDEPVVLQFKIHSPTSPRENGYGKDRRKLGVALYGLELGH